jgi:hypothetical protein
MIDPNDSKDAKNGIFGKFSSYGIGKVHKKS